MSPLFLRRSAATVALGLFTSLTLGCVAGGGGYGNESVGFGADYYEPYGYDYGGWGGDYRVGPFRGEGRGEDRGGGPRASHAFRSAPASHSMPSIPSGSRGGGGRSGGGRGGGGGHR